MFDAFAEIKEVKFEVRVFRDFQAATDWLGMNIPPTEPNTPQS